MGVITFKDFKGSKETKSTEEKVPEPIISNFVVKNSKKVSVKIVEQESLNKPKVKFNKL